MPGRMQRQSRGRERRAYTRRYKYKGPRTTKSVIIRRGVYPLTTKALFPHK